MRRNPLLLVLCFALILSGCGTKDIDKRFFVVSLGVDTVEGNKTQFRFSFKMAVPKSRLRHGDSEFVIMSVESETVAGATAKLKTLVDKEPDFGHLKLVVFSEDTAGRGLLPVTDWLHRYSDIQKICWLAIGRPTAREILAYKPKSERYPSNNLFMTFDHSGAETDTAITQYIFSFGRDVTEPGIDAVLPVIQDEKQALGISRAAVFGGDKLALILKPEETKLLNIMKRTAPEVELNLADGLGEGLEHAAVHGFKVGASYRLEEGERLAIRMNLKVRGELEEIHPHTVLTEEQIKNVEMAAEAYLTSHAKSLLEKCRDGGLDPVGFGLRYRSKHWDSREAETEAWKQLYPQVEFKVRAEVKITSTGRIK